ncbi:hypothetical protein LTR99_004948 [Exophiala xenobiotica]|uniref:Uncharacterized protein n=1 Tax=Vermiconidia calcicola TaxID=1690605 RepID=A0AAV9QD69_9PEZI|nr:hypothetical protein LTR99_004948 [Exophiala xenobiotica]KAK5433182.1 hypothetical protein LTR34_004656 [Exophiala xenobiotica]KAK5540227.1 hypothetical protein LTR25_003933 [Vermiconidia calcicola]
MLTDFIGTERLNNEVMETRLRNIGKRYALGWFKGRDGQIHCAIDEEPARLSLMTRSMLCNQGKVWDDHIDFYGGDHYQTLEFSRI